MADSKNRRAAKIRCYIAVISNVDIYKHINTGARITELPSDFSMLSGCVSLTVFRQFVLSTSPDNVVFLNDTSHTWRDLPKLFAMRMETRTFQQKKKRSIASVNIIHINIRIKDELLLYQDLLVEISKVDKKYIDDLLPRNC